MDHNVVRRWLRQVLAPYPSSDRVYADVDAVLEAFSSLAPKTEVYTYDTGHTSLLLTLQGTVPVTFRGATYHIPLALWLPRAYPREPPIAYVTPTSTMLVRPGGGVDVSGRIEGAPYLIAWLKKWEACNLLELIHSLQESFGRAPPVYAKPTSPSPASASPAPAPAPTPAAGPQDPRQRPPPPVGSPSMAGPPSRPPKPGQAHQRSDSLPPPAPAPQPPQGSSGYASPRHSYAPSHRLSAGPQQTYDAPAPAPWAGGGGHGHSASLSYAPHQQQQQRQDSWPVVQSPSSTAAPALPPPPPPPSGALSPPPQAQAQHQASQPAPPRPPNPELLSLQSLLSQKLNAALSAFQSTSAPRAQQLSLLIADLERGAPAVHDEMARLEAVRDVCRATGDGLGQSVEQAKARIAELDRRGEVSPDELICATSLVGNQLIDLVAHDNAIEDCLYHLGRALNAEQLDLERFLKQTRFLAREQFMKRALAMRICKGMGWADEGALELEGFGMGAGR